MSAQQFFLKVLEQIYQSQQGFTVQTSIYLKKIDDYLFVGKGPQSLNSKQAQLLYLGVSEKKYQGLFQLAGVKATFGGLKKSSFLALDIIYKSVSKGKHKQIFQKTFTDCDQEDFKLLRLATHITQSKNENALQLCGILKSKRPYLNQSDYIFSQQSRNLFIKWYQSQKKKHKKVQVQRRSILQPPEQSFIQKKQNMMDNFVQGILKLVQIKTNIQELQFYQDYIVQDQQQYYIDTFVDPIDILEFRKRNPEIREIMGFRQFIYYLTIIPITKIARSAIQKFIDKIHIQSQNFDPQVLVQKFHKKLIPADKMALSKIIPLHFGVQWSKNLAKYYFEYFVQLAKTITLVKDNFIQNQTIKTQASVGFSLRTQMKQSMRLLCDKVQPLSQKYQNTQKLRKLILFLQTNSQFLKMPETIKKLLDQRNFKAICILYKKYQVLIEVYKNTPIIKDIIEEIQNMIVQVRIKQIQNIIQKNLDIEQIQILVDLFTNKKQTIIEYIVPKLISHLIKSIDDKQTNENIESILKKAKKYEMINFNKTIQFQKIKTYILQQQDQGDLLEEFLSTSNQNQNILQKSNNLKDKIITKFRNFFTLKNKWINQYKCTFKELKVLIQVMITWYAKMIEQVIQSKFYDLVNITSQILIIAQNNTQQMQLSKQISKLKESNFQAYCILIAQKTKQQIQFKKCLIRRDTQGNYFNDLLIKILDEVSLNIKSILKFPSFTYKQFFIQRVYKYIQGCIIVEDNKLSSLSELFTYSTLLICISQSQITKSFYKQLSQFKNLKSHLNQVLKKHISKIDSNLYSIIKIEYRSTINRNKNRSYAFTILEYLNECYYLLNQYSSINYKKHSRFMIEGFQQIAMEALPQMIKEGYGKIFIRELELIKTMTNKIQTKRINSKWQHLLKHIQFTAEQKSQKELYILENKHKFSANFCGLMDY